MESRKGPQEQERTEQDEQLQSARLCLGLLRPGVVGREPKLLNNIGCRKQLEFGLTLTLPRQTSAQWLSASSASFLCFPPWILPRTPPSPSLPTHLFPGVRLMNETRQALLCLKMSLVPRKENKSSAWLLWKGRGWDGRLFSSWALERLLSIR